VTTALPKIPNSIAVNATVTFTGDTSVVSSEAGVSGRKSMRPVLREFMVTVNPSESLEVQKIAMASRVQRRPFSVRDYTAFSFADEILTHDGTTAEMRRLWAPSAGPFSEYERILIPDESEVTTVVKVNGTPLLRTDWDFADFGKIVLDTPITPSDGLTGDILTVSGEYLQPVCFVDNPSATILRGPSSRILYQFSDLRLRQIFEAELIALTA
jgi:hypothetical protein